MVGIAQFIELLRLLRNYGLARARAGSRAARLSAGTCRGILRAARRLRQARAPNGNARRDNSRAASRRELAKRTQRRSRRSAIARLVVFQWKASWGDCNKQVSESQMAASASRAAAIVAAISASECAR